MVIFTMGRKRVKEVLDDLTDVNNDLHELEAENRLLLSMIMMLSTHDKCWCPKSIARDKMIQAGLNVKHCKACETIRRHLCKT